MHQSNLLETTYENYKSYIYHCIDNGESQYLPKPKLQIPSVRQRNPKAISYAKDYSLSKYNIPCTNPRSWSQRTEFYSDYSNEKGKFGKSVGYLCRMVVHSWNYTARSRSVKKDCRPTITSQIMEEFDLFFFFFFEPFSLHSAFKPATWISDCIISLSTNYQSSVKKMP